MLQTGMNRDQISQLAQKGISSSASLANMLGKQRSFDQLMSLDFQSMQSIDNLANLIQAGMPNQAGGLGGRIQKSQMKNMDWGTQGVGGPLGHAGAPGPAGLLSSTTGGVKSSIENLVRTLSANSGSNSNAQVGSSNNTLANQANDTNFGSFLQNASQQGNNPLAGVAAAAAAGQVSGGGSANDFSNYIQSLTQPQSQNANQGNGNVHYGNLLQGMAGSMGGSAASLLQNNNANSLGSLNGNLGGGNDLMNMLNQSANSLSQTQNHLNPLMQQLTNDQFGGALQNAGQGNPMMAALAQQQLLAQAANNTGGGNNMSNLLGQQNGLAGLAGMNNPLGNFGAALGGNLGGLGGSNFGGGGGQQNNAAALLQQLIAQQQNGGNGANQAQGNDGGGTKRSIDDVNGGDDDGGASKKQTVSL